MLPTFLILFLEEEEEETTFFYNTHFPATNPSHLLFCGFKICFLLQFQKILGFTESEMSFCDPLTADCWCAVQDQGRGILCSLQLPVSTGQQAVVSPRSGQVGAALRFQDGEIRLKKK